MGSFEQGSFTQNLFAFYEPYSSHFWIIQGEELYTLSALLQGPYNLFGGMCYESVLLFILSIHLAVF